MLEIKITLNATELSEAINNLANALTCNQSNHTVCNQQGENNTDIDNAGTLNMDFTATPEPTEVAPNPTVPTAPATATQTVPTAQTAPNVSCPTPDVAPATSASEPQYTLEMIARAGTALVDAGKMGELTALLAKYGVEILTQLAPTNYSNFAAELRAMGAQI